MSTYLWGLGGMLAPYMCGIKRETGGQTGPTMLLRFFGATGRKKRCEPSVFTGLLHANTLEAPMLPLHF